MALKDYTATITFTWTVRAHGEEQAQERAELLAEALTKKPVAHTWAGDMQETTVEVECDE